ncbi:hypothetical protein JCM3770_005982 [Rhodotorula araucariae]
MLIITSCGYGGSSLAKSVTFAWGVVVILNLDDAWLAFRQNPVLKDFVGALLETEQGQSWRTSQLITLISLRAGYLLNYSFFVWELYGSGPYATALLCRCEEDEEAALLYQPLHTRVYLQVRRGELVHLNPATKSNHGTWPKLVPPSLGRSLHRAAWNGDLSAWTPDVARLHSLLPRAEWDRQMVDGQADLIALNEWFQHRMNECLGTYDLSSWPSD